MKIWVKYLIGIALGLLSALILPVPGQEFLYSILGILIRLGGYVLIPFVFFSAIMAIYRLNDAKLVGKTVLWSVILIVGSSLLLTIIGFISSVVVKLPNLPIITIADPNPDSFSNVHDLVDTMIPFSRIVAPHSYEGKIIPALISQNDFLIFGFIFAMILGAGCCIEHSNLKPVLSLVDSLSELFYNIITVFTDLLSIGMIAIMCRWFINIKGVLASGQFTPLIITLSVIFILVAGVIYPLIVRFVCNSGKPYKVLSACVVPFFTAFLTGDTYLTLPVNMRLGKEKLGIRQRTNGFSYPLFAIFARGGSALAVIISFAVISRSYSGSLGLDFFDMLWISGAAFFFSFLLGGIPAEGKYAGTFAALKVLCTMYGHGNSGYLLLIDAAPIIACFAALFDAATAMFGTYIVANKTKTIEKHRA